VTGADDKWVTLGRVLGPWGLKGWLKVVSYTDPLDNIVRFPKWVLCRGNERRVERLEAGQAHGGHVVAKLASVDDRDVAAELAGTEIRVERSELAPCAEGEYYWADLEGLRVVTRAGVELGEVERLFGTGSNDVMVVRGARERLVPFIAGQVVLEVDLDVGRIVVEWDPDF
jgi:16S rRNA processing protein RimM